MIELTHVTKTFIQNKNKRFNALDDINLNLPSKGMIFIVGKSGSGKSTLLNLLGGLDQASGGNIMIADFDLVHMNSNELSKYRNSFVGLIFQEHNLIKELNVEDQLKFFASIQGIHLNDEKVTEILRFVDLDGYQKRDVNKLSGGEKQRVAIARALSKSSYLILADEPTGSLDSENSTKIFETLKKISLTQLVVIVTHDEESALFYADELIRIKDGKIINDQKINQSIDSVQEIKLKSVKTPLISLLKITLGGMVFKPVRLILTTLLLFLTMSLALIALSMQLFDFKTYQAEAIVAGNDYTYSINKYKDTNDLGLMVDNFDQDDYQVISSMMNDETLLKINTGYDPIDFINISHDALNGYEPRYIYTKVSGVAAIDDHLMDALNLELYAGRLPESLNEIAITLYMYENLLTLGFLYDDVEIDISNPNDLFNQTISLSDQLKDVQITGIIDTNFNDSYYNKLLLPNEFWSTDYPYLQTEFEREMSMNIHQVIFIDESYMFLNDDVDHIQVNHQEYSSIFSIGSHSIRYETISHEDQYDTFVVNDIDAGYYLSFNQLSQLGYSLIDLQGTYYEWILEYVKNPNNISRSSIYDALTYSESLNDEPMVIDDYDTWENDSFYYDMYAYLLYGKVSLFTPMAASSILYAQNPYGLSGFEIHQLAYLEIIPQMTVFQNEMSITLRLANHSYLIDALPFKGLVFDTASDLLILDDTTYETINQKSIRPNITEVFGLSSNGDNLSELMVFSEKTDHYSIQQNTYFRINNVKTDVNIMVSVIVFIFVPIFIMMFVLLSQLIHLSMVDQTKSLGVLMSTGLRSIHIFIIYLMMTLIMCILPVILSFITSTVILDNLSNNLILHRNLLPLFNNEWLVLMILILAILVIMGLNILLNLFRFLKSKPIKVIQSV